MDDFRVADWGSANPSPLLCQEEAKASCCTEDDGRSIGVALQGGVSNSHKLLWSKATVVNVMVKRRNLIASCVVERDERKRTFDEASKGADDIKTKVLKVL